MYWIIAQVKLKLHYSCITLTCLTQNIKSIKKTSNKTYNLLPMCLLVDLFNQFTYISNWYSCKIFSAIINGGLRA